MEKILKELNLYHFMPKFQAQNVDLTLLSNVSITTSDGQPRLRMISSIQEILMKKCGLNTTELMLIVKAIQQKGLRGNSANITKDEQLQPQDQRSTSFAAFQAKGGNKRMQALLAPAITQQQKLIQKNSNSASQLPSTACLSTNSDVRSSQSKSIEQQNSSQKITPVPTYKLQQVPPCTNQQLSKKTFLEDALQVTEPYQPQKVASVMKEQMTYPQFKSPPVKETRRMPQPQYTPNTREKCNPLSSENNFLYVENKLLQHRQNIIQQYGSSKVPTPSRNSVVSKKSSPTQNYINTYGNDIQAFIEEAAPTDKAVGFDFDDELSQIVNPERQPQPAPQFQESQQKNEKAQSFVNMLNETEYCQVSQNLQFLDQGDYPMLQYNLKPQTLESPQRQENVKDSNRSSTLTNKQQDQPYLLQSIEDIVAQHTAIEPASDPASVTSEEQQQYEGTYYNDKDKMSDQEDSLEIDTHQAIPAASAIQKQMLWKTGQQTSYPSQIQICGSSSSSDSDSNNEQQLFVQIQQQNINAAVQEMTEEELSCDEQQQTYDGTVPHNNFSDLEENSVDEYLMNKQPDEQQPASVPQPAMLNKHYTFANTQTSNQITLTDSCVQTAQISEAAPYIVQNIKSSVGIYVKPVLVDTECQWITPTVSPQQSPTRIYQQSITNQDLQIITSAAPKPTYIEQQPPIAKPVASPIKIQQPSPSVNNNIEYRTSLIQRNFAKEGFKSPTAKFVINNVNSAVNVANTPVVNSLKQRPSNLLMQSPTPKTQDSDREIPSSIAMSKTFANQSPNTQHQLQQLNRPLTSKFTLTKSPVKPSQIQKRKRKVTFDDFQYLDEQAIESELQKEDEIAYQRGSQRKLQEQNRKQRIRAKQEAKQERHEANNRRREANGISIAQKSVIDEQQNRSRSKPQKYYDENQDSDEEVQIVAPPSKRFKQSEAEQIKPAMSSNFKGFGMSSEAQERMKKMQSLIGS